LATNKFGKKIVRGLATTIIRCYSTLMYNGNIRQKAHK